MTPVALERERIRQYAIFEIKINVMYWQVAKK